MKKIGIDLLNVFRTGMFNNLKVGQTKDWLITNFPEPDNIINGDNLWESNYWRYGNIDFFFEENKLKEICSRSIDPLIGGKSIEFDKWIFKQPDNLSLEYVLDILISEQIDFTLMHSENEIISQVSIGLIKSSVYLIFQYEEPEEDNSDLHSNSLVTNNKKEFKLVGFSIFENLETFNAILKRKNGL